MTDVESTTPAIDLIFDTDCPHVDDARQLLRDALLATGLPPRWREWNRDAADTPLALRGLGSPSIVVDGKDVSTGRPPATVSEIAKCCRIYFDGHEFRGAPAFDAVIRALAITRSG